MNLSPRWVEWLTSAPHATPKRKKPGARPGWRLVPVPEGASEGVKGRVCLHQLSVTAKDRSQNNRYEFPGLRGLIV